MIENNQSKPSFWLSVKNFFGFDDVTYEKEEQHHEIATKAAPTPFKGSLVHSKNSRSFNASEIKVEEPRIYEDSLSIASHLRENLPVVVNLKFLDKTSSKRLVDFICGTAYAINGHMMKIGENIFLFTPANVLIANSEEKTTFEAGVEEEEKEVFFKKVANIKTL